MSPTSVNTRLWTLLLAVALSGCVDSATGKVAVTKGMNSAVGAEASEKSGPSERVRHARTFTSLHLDSPASKTVSSIALNESQGGALESSDPRMDDGTHYDLWEIRISSSRVVDVQLSSDAFDTYLMIAEGAPGDGGSVVASDDDGGGGTNSRLQGALEAGTYTIVANSFWEDETGSYSLSVSDDSGSGGGGSGGGGSGDAVRGSVEAGQTVSGSLSSSDVPLADGSYFHVWQMWGEAGDEVTITLTSDDFDAYLLFAYGSSLESAEFLAEDDDGAGDLNSRITYTLPESGVYSILANTYGSGQTGQYRLAVESAAVDWAARFPGGGDPNGKYAVVVGLDDYPGTANDLRGPVEDGILFRDVLVERFGFPEENIVFLQDGEGTRAGIANAIVRHLGQAGPDGTAAFFYSGHGTQLDENIGLTGRFDSESGNSLDEALAVYDGMILDDEVGYLLQQIEARNTLVVIDACFSGTATRGADAMPKFIARGQADGIRVSKNFITAELGTGLGFGAGVSGLQDALSNPDRHVLMAASSEDELSWAIGRWPDRQGPASLYTYYWAKVMRNAPTNTTFRQAHEMISDSVRTYVGGNQGVDTQTPQLLGPNRDASIGAFLGGQ